MYPSVGGAQVEGHTVRAPLEAQLYRSRVERRLRVVTIRLYSAWRVSCVMVHRLETAAGGA